MANNYGNSLDLVIVEDIKDDTVIMRNGRLCQVLMVGGINFSLKSEEEQNVLTRAYQSFLNSLNFSIQVIVHSRKINIEKYLAVLSSREELEPSTLLKSQISEYREFIRGFVHNNSIMAKTFFIVVPFSPISLPSKKSVLGFLPFGKKSGADSAQKEERERVFTENVSQLRQRTTQVIDGLFAIGLEAIQLDNRAISELFYNFYNPESTEKGTAAVAEKVK